MEMLYQKIVDDLKSKILDQTYKTDSKVPTELELAEEYHVSRITSKRALEELKNAGYIYRKRGSGSFVSAVRQQNSSSSTGKCIAVITPKGVSNGTFAPAIRGASDVLQKTSHSLKLYTDLQSPEQVDRLLQELYRSEIAGIIYYPISEMSNFETLNMLCMNSFPIVTVDKYFDCLPLSSVVSDNFNGGLYAAQYFVELHHTRIAFVSDLPLERTSSIRNRYFGYCAALQKHGIAVDKELVVMGTWTDEFARGYQPEIYVPLLQSLITKGATAVCAANDLIASFILRAAYDAGINIPGDISVMGFDNSDMAAFLQPGLTTIAQDFYMMGKKAGELLLSSFYDGKLSCTRTVLPVNLVVRKTCIEYVKKAEKK